MTHCIVSKFGTWFPKDPVRREKWKKAARVATLNQYASVCSAHFRPGEITVTRCGVRSELIDGCVPSKFPWGETSTQETGCACLNPDQNETVIHQDHTYSNTKDEMICVLKRKLKSAEDRANYFKVKSKNAKRREKIAKEALQTVVSILKREHQMNSELAGLLEAYKDIPLELFEKPTLEYSEEQKKFASTLYSYSIKAYMYVRESLHLPPPSSVRGWSHYVSPPSIHKEPSNSDEECDEKSTVLKSCTDFDEAMHEEHCEADFDLEMHEEHCEADFGEAIPEEHCEADFDLALHEEHCEADFGEAIPEEHCKTKDFNQSDSD
ncbi:hypothetical protein CAPTEDRAFT_198570 [Capitella teleta]|uniref:THAP-type domain-containing protein n=1 Tax=Capitella teleta TaxID=283909 RepID=R7TXU2_CAPTE|nr:hypothetical protein CAPTEDRAFT_198570 [Capitella teleta]|eukprot:ELT98738.1 hypothetical protein CAPTEDRAFT_198570 [Capitella teleta]